jgi:transcriptional regulator with XRE-family HTH domain
MSDPLSTHIGERIRAKRLELGFGQNDFASLVGIETERLSQVEKGDVRLTPMQTAAVCKLLRTQVAWLYEDAPQGVARPQHPALPKPNFAVTLTDRQQLVDNFDRLNSAGQQQLLDMSFKLMAMVGKAKA